MSLSRYTSAWWSHSLCGYGDGAVRVSNSIVVAPMDVLQSLEKNKDKILTKNAA